MKPQALVQGYVVTLLGGLDDLNQAHGRVVLKTPSDGQPQPLLYYFRLLESAGKPAPRSLLSTRGKLTRDLIMGIADYVDEILHAEGMGYLITDTVELFKTSPMGLRLMNRKEWSALVA